jgi:DNA repair protein RadC
VPSAALGEVRCRQILVELLGPFGAAAQGWADRLVDEFGSLAAVLAASPDALARTVGDESAVRQLRAVRAAMLQALKTEALTGPVLSDSETLIDYLFADMAHLPTERLRVLFLNAKNRLLRDEVMGEGSINETSIYPREIMRRALEIGATALILAHNHPSGDPKPSRVDVEATYRVVEAGRPFDIRVHDHVIIARSGWSSFRVLGLI